MSAHGGPNIIEDGLVLALDAANIKSFRGPVQTNVLTGINYIFSNTDTATFKITNGTLEVDIPRRGRRVVKYVDIFNDYNGGSGQCCPNLFNFGDITVSGNTTYTYSIIYKTTTGYTNGNYMYRYEYNGGTYVTEGGVHSTENRTDLGDGWYHAWGTFTTNANTNRLLTYLFHYEYATYNRVFVESVQITQGSYIGAPEHMLTPSQVRGATVATGGGWADRSGTGNNGELVNGPTFGSSNGGSIVFDGVNDYISATSSNVFNNFSYDIWCLPTATHEIDAESNSSTTGTSGQRYLIGPVFQGDPDAGSGISVGTNGVSVYEHASGYMPPLLVYSATINSIVHIVVNYTNKVPSLYLNGVFIKNGLTSPRTNVKITTNEIGAHSYGGFSGNIYSAKFYNRALSASEVLQNYNATKGRFGL
jgi:hypothetical protein